MTERICIVGVGAIGGLYAAHLGQLTDTEVWAFDPAQEHVAAINRDGLRLTGHVELTARIHARSVPAEIPPCGLGILATKGTATEAAIAATARIFESGAVCSVQNGIGNEEVIAGHVPRVMRGVTLPAGHFAAPGVIHMDAPGPTWIGPFEPQPALTDEIDRLADHLNRSGMEAHALLDARGAQWTKLLFNASTNPLCALSGLTTVSSASTSRPGDWSRELIAEDGPSPARWGSRWTATPTNSSMRPPASTSITGRACSRT